MQQHGMTIALAASAAVLLGCAPQECAYFNDCPSGQYCTGEGFCTDFGGDDGAMYEPEPDAPGWSDEQTSDPYEVLSSTLSGEFSPAGPFSQAAASAVVDGAGYGFVFFHVAHELEDGSVVFTVFELPKEAFEQETVISATDTLMMGCSSGVDEIDVPPVDGSVTAKPGEDGRVTVEFSGEFVEPDGQPALLFGQVELETTDSLY